MKLVFLLCIMLTIVTAQNTRCKNATAVFNFGDSLTDNGNNNYFVNVPFTIARANHTPYGIDYDNQQPTGRFSNNKVAPDLVAEYCGIRRSLPYLSPFTSGSNLTQGVNFASGGAAILDTLSSNLTPYNFSLQIQWFRNVAQRLQQLEGVTNANKRIANAIYILTFGSNDFSQKALSNYSSTPDSDFRSLIISVYKSRIQDIYNIGARRFVVSALGPLGCTPIAISLQCNAAFLPPFPPSCNRSACNENSNSLAQAFNTDLQTMLNSLNTSLPGIKIYYNTDAYTITRDAISNPSKYGYTVVDRGCCGSGYYEIGDGCNGTIICSNRSNYTFFDAIHPEFKLINTLTTRLYPALAT